MLLFSFHFGKCYTDGFAGPTKASTSRLISTANTSTSRHKRADIFETKTFYLISVAAFFILTLLTIGFKVLIYKHNHRIIPMASGIEFEPSEPVEITPNPGASTIRSVHSYYEIIDDVIVGQ